MEYEILASSSMTKYIAMMTQEVFEKEELVKPTSTSQLIY